MGFTKKAEKTCAHKVLACYINTIFCFEMDPIPLVPKAYLIDVDLKTVHFGIPLLIVSSIYEYFIKYFVQAWNKSDHTILHSLLSKRIDPHLLLLGLSATYVGIRPLKNMFDGCEFLIDLF